MKHMACGKVALLGVFALAGCYSYASEAINNSNYRTVQASPNFIVVKVGDSTQVIVRLVNDNNNGAITSYTIGGAPSGIAVHYGVNYRPIIGSGTDTLMNTIDKVAQQYYVLGLTTGQYSFTVTPTLVNTSVSATVTVVVLPITLGPALSKIAAVAGDTVVITAPAGSVFSQTSAVTFQTGTFAIVARAADSSTITLIVDGGITGPATVTKVGVKANPGVQTATLVTSNSLTTPALVGPTLSPTTAPAGGTVTLTAAPNTVFSQTSAITITAGPTPPITARAADSSTISFIVGPSDSGAITVTDVGVKNAPVLGVATLVSVNSLTLVPPVTVAPSTVSNLTPSIGVSVTVQLGGSLRFIASSHVFIGGVEAGIQSVSADSSTATVLPDLSATGGPGSGLVTYTNIVLSFLNTVPLSVPGDKTFAIGAAYGGPSDPNAGTIGTASTITLPPSGRSFVFADAGSFTNSAPCATAFSTDGCRWFKVVVAASTTIDIDARWQGGSDNGLYILNSTGTGRVAAADNLSQAPGNEPETATVTLAAGTYFFGQVFFGVNSGYPPSVNTVAPAYFLFRITTH